MIPLVPYEIRKAQNLLHLAYTPGQLDHTGSKKTNAMLNTLSRSSHTPDKWVFYSMYFGYPFRRPSLGRFLRPY